MPFFTSRTHFPPHWVQSSATIPPPKPDLYENTGPVVCCRYTSQKRLVGQRDAIYECNALCACHAHGCANRVIGKGLGQRLQVLRIFHFSSLRVHSIISEARSASCIMFRGVVSGKSFSRALALSLLLRYEGHSHTLPDDAIENGW